MTQYIRGGTVGRTGAAAQWGVRDLRRRPPILSEAGALPFAWLRWSEVGTPFSATTATVYNFFDLNAFDSGGTSWYTSDSTIFQPDEVNGFINTNPDAIGVIHSRVWASFDSIDYDFVETRQTWLSAEDISGGDIASYVTGFANKGNFLLCVPVGESPPSLLGEFQQTSGVTEDLLGLSILVVRQALYPATGGTTFP